jgi:hypothetical protein
LNVFQHPKLCRCIGRSCDFHKAIKAILWAARLSLQRDFYRKTQFFRANTFINFCQFLNVLWCCLYESCLTIFKGIFQLRSSNDCWYLPS